MSLRNRLALPVIFSALALLAGCGSSGTTGTPPPTGGFSDSNLNGTYVFSVSGTDGGGAPYAILGTLTANGSGGISGGALDLNDAQITPVPDAAISGSSSYKVGPDGRGQATLKTSTPFGTILLDFVLQDSSHGLTTEFDANATGSGTLDVQTAGTTPTGSYAFNLAGGNSTGVFEAVGDFTLNGTSLSGLEDMNNAAAIYSNLTLTGQLTLGPSSTPSTTLINSSFTQTYDAIAIDATHLKLIEMDTGSTLEGDAYSQTSTSMPVGTLPFTLIGLNLSGDFGAGGFIVTDNAGDITNASTEDYNADGTTVTSAPVPFMGNYAPVQSSSGRYTLSNFSGFQGATEFVAYPSSAGLFLLEIDGGGTLFGIAYPAQSSTTFASGQGYGMNLSGILLSDGVEVDDIAEFTAASSGAVTGYVDENFTGSGGGTANISLGTTSAFSAPTAGRGQIGTGTNSIGTLNGGFLLTYYTVDGTTVPFIESDNGQVATGVLLEQNASASSAELARAAVKHLYVLPGMARPRKMQPKQK